MAKCGPKGSAHVSPKYERRRLRQSYAGGFGVGKIGIEKPLKPGYKTPRRFAIKMQSWVDSGARFNIARKQKRVDEWAATIPDPRGLRFQAKLAR